MTIPQIHDFNRAYSLYENKQDIDLEELIDYSLEWAIKESYKIFAYSLNPAAILNARRFIKKYAK